MGELGGRVEREVRRPDHGDGIRSRLRSIRGEGHRVRGRLGSAVGRHLEPSLCGREEAAQPSLPLLDGEEHSFAVRPEGEQAVEAARSEKIAVGAERVLVERRTAVAKRRESGGEGPTEHDATLARDGWSVSGRRCAELPIDHLGSAAMGSLRVERDGDILRVTMARPEARNAFDAAMITELAEAFVDVGQSRAVVLAGDGASFCAGADLDWMRTSIDLDYDANVADATGLRRMLDAIDSCPAPVVAVIQGHALGGGAGLVACADIAIAHEQAVFAFSEVKLGLIPAVISPFALRKIGESAARRYFVTGERFDAATAFRIGLVHEVTGDLDGALERVLTELRTAGPRAARHAKRLVLERPDGPETARRIAERRTSDEGQEGLLAFLERRRPGWSG